MLIILGLPFAFWLLGLLRDVLCTCKAYSDGKNALEGDSWCRFMISVCIRAVLLISLEFSICAALDLKGNYINDEERDELID